MNNIIKAIRRGTDRDVPRDLDQEQPGFMEGMERRLREINHDHVEPPPVAYAPPPTRIADAIMEGKDSLLEEVKKTIETVRTVVKKEIKQMRAELDNLEEVVDKSTEATVAALENQLNIAAHARLSCTEIKEKIESFSGTVASSLPKADL